MYNKLVNLADFNTEFWDSLSEDVKKSYELLSDSAGETWDKMSPEKMKEFVSNISPENKEVKSAFCNVYSQLSLEKTQAIADLMEGKCPISSCSNSNFYFELLICFVLICLF